MSMTSVPRSERVHIALFGNRNSGKSSLINALTGQPLSIVSEQKGTTTDPVSKSIEILPLGPCVLIDTAGMDDEGALGSLRVGKSLEVLDKCDIALMVVDASVGVTPSDTRLATRLAELGRPAMALVNKCDLVPDPERTAREVAAALNLKAIAVSAADGRGVDAVKNLLPTLLPEEKPHTVLDGIVEPGDLAVLVCPIDSAAPKARLILPQQQVIRELCDRGCGALVCQVGELEKMLGSLTAPPKIVITDSQVFRAAADIVPESVPLTGFSILFARGKGDLRQLSEGARAIARLEDGDRVLIAEGCTHHRRQDDIGTVKIPRWLREMTGKSLVFEYSSGAGFTPDVSRYKLIVHCGGCMLTRRAMLNRLAQAKEYGVPIVNYGVMIAAANGVLERALLPFKNEKDLQPREKTLY